MLPNESPRITKFAWGLIEVAGGRRYKDAKLFPGGSRAWDWRETGTAHVPGIQPADVEELIENGALVIILSRGVHEQLQVSKDTLDLLESEGIPAHVLQTEKAVELYNRLCEHEPVGGLFHSTC